MCEYKALIENKIPESTANSILLLIIYLCIYNIEIGNIVKPHSIYVFPESINKNKGFVVYNIPDNKDTYLLFVKW